MNGEERFAAHARQLGCALTPEQCTKQFELLDELARWNKAYNLTSIVEREAMITHHLLDSLSAHAFLQGERIADVGTGGGFPGLPLAIANPHRRFTLIDTVAKKIRFVAHAARTLALDNVDAVHARVEDLHDATAFPTVIARAFAPLPRLLELVDPLCGAGTRVLAMKGKRPDDEIADMGDRWRVVAIHALEVPGLDAERHLVEIERASHGGSA